MTAVPEMVIEPDQQTALQNLLLELASEAALKELRVHRLAEQGQPEEQGGAVQLGGVLQAAPPEEVQDAAPAVRLVNNGLHPAQADHQQEEHVHVEMSRYPEIFLT